MRSLIKSVIPKRFVPVAHRIYLNIFADTPKADFTDNHYEALAALKCVVSYNKYGGYCVPESSRHRPAARKILSNDVFEPQTIELIRVHCGEGDIVHAGTYFGDFLPALSDAAAPGSKIWAFEPNSENYRCARITLEINGIDNVALTNAGLGAKRERRLMQTADGDGRPLGGASRIIDDHHGEKIAEAEAVQVMTIDDVVGRDRQVSVIQLDVEGHEKAALRGALATIRRCLPALILEVLPGSTLLGGAWFEEHILSLGYQKIDEVHGNAVFSCSSAPSGVGPI